MEMNEMAPSKYFSGDNKLPGREMTKSIKQAVK